jgi:dihydroneopterin aldolase
VSFTVELHDLEVPGKHGVEDDERQRNRIFLFDVSFDVADTAMSDRIEDAVDYREVAACIKEVSDARTYNLIEVLAAAVADAIVARFPVDWVRVRARKPDLRVAGLHLGESVAVVERAR